MNNAFLDYFRCPDELSPFRQMGEPIGAKGFFRFGKDAVCFGRTFSGRVAQSATSSLEDVLPSVQLNEHACYLPFDAGEIVENLRLERYCKSPSSNGSGPKKSLVRNAYYAVRPLLPVSVRKHLQRAALRGWDQIPFPHWPVDQSVDRILETMLLLAIRTTGDRIPFIWFWPDGHDGCATMTHDVETAQGRDFCSSLMDLNDSFGIKSSFQVVPEERYAVPEKFLSEIRERGFEVNVHDLNHDGNLFQERIEFLHRAAQINLYAKSFGAVGYRSGVLYRNLDWYDAFDFSYDMSVPNVGHLDPQQGGCCTTKPYFVGKILEIPVTATQDYTLFNILRQYSTDLWQKQVQSILGLHGMASFIVHPDYVINQRAREVYAGLLAYLARLRQDSNLWIALPREVNDWWRMRQQSTLVRRGDGWKIEGPAGKRARIAYASAEGDRVTYDIEPVS
jgi:hypothetical protein